MVNSSSINASTTETISYAVRLLAPFVELLESDVSFLFFFTVGSNHPAPTAILSAQNEVVKKIPLIYLFYFRLRLSRLRNC